MLSCRIRRRCCYYCRGYTSQSFIIVTTKLAKKFTIKLFKEPVNIRCTGTMHELVRLSKFDLAISIDSLSLELVVWSTSKTCVHWSVWYCMLESVLHAYCENWNEGYCHVVILYLSPAIHKEGHTKSPTCILLPTRPVTKLLWRLALFHLQVHCRKKLTLYAYRFKI